MPTRCVAAITPATAPPRVPHYLGLPPELGGDRADRRLLPWPQILVLEERPDGVFLFRFTRDGTYAGDTWHATVEAAQAQAVYEYADHLGAWHALPDDVQDTLAAARSIVATAAAPPDRA